MPESTVVATSSDLSIAARSADATSSQAGTTGDSPSTASPAETSQSSASIAPGDTVSSTTRDGLVKVQLLCSMSYTTDLYDTPSGHLDEGYYLDTGGASASSTTMAPAHVIGQQAWTQCHDNQGNVHEFKLSKAEYAALAVRGMPQEYVMEAADQAVLDSFPDSQDFGPVPVIATSTAPAEVPLDAPTATEEASSTTSQTDTTSIPAAVATTTDETTAPDASSSTPAASASTTVDNAGASTTSDTATDATTSPSDNSIVPPATTTYCATIWMRTARQSG